MNHQGPAIPDSRRCRRSAWQPCWILLILLAGGGATTRQAAGPARLELAGMAVTPHLRLESMRYRREPEPAEGARVQLFLRHPGDAGAAPLALDSTMNLRFEGKTPLELLSARAWAWHDTPAALSDARVSLPAGALTVWTFNGRTLPWGPGGRPGVEIGRGGESFLSARLTIDAPRAWISAITFLAREGEIRPDRMIVHLSNEGPEKLSVRSCRLWLPRDGVSPRALFAQPRQTALEFFGGLADVSAGEKGGFLARTAPLPLSYTAVEVEVASPGGVPSLLWAHLRIKPERFDISGGWVSGKERQVTQEPFLKALKRLHVNTAHLAEVPGYTDTELYARYPLKYFNRLMPLERYDTDAMLPRIHAVEFLGEPQYGGGRPVPPQEVWERLQPYASSRLATSLTHSEERIWRDYAGLSDFPHYDAYRVSAPSADAWALYDRWGGERLRWGAPLETIGDMSRSLRELNRPMPCACWSQGPHAGWEVYGGRQRTSPTPEEIRLQAYHAVSTRITSLYWFNLSLRSLVKFRDTLDELSRIGRELRMLDEFLLEGNAYRHERLKRPDGTPDWDVASVCGPQAGLLFALDLDYRPDTDKKVFSFGPPRAATWHFPLPPYLRKVTDVFRIDADGVRSVRWIRRGNGIDIRDRLSQVGVWIVSPDRGLRSRLEAKLQQLLKEEAGWGFDPARNDADFEQLVRLSASK